MNEMLASTTLTMSVTRTIAYDVRHVERYVFDPAEDALAECIARRPALFVIDEALWDAHGAALEAYAATRLDTVAFLPISGDEAEKTLGSVERICLAANERKMPRDGVFVAVGGGVVLDTVGFAASIYRRGVPYLRIPTTLIGIVDVAVGIKQAINFHGKNRLGAFYPPIGNINDTRFLATLPARHLSCGIAEIVKMALVGDVRLFELVETHGAEFMRSAFSAPREVALEVILRAERAMMLELTANLFEESLQRLVDFAHTFGPTFETASNYAVNHGEAVALDMLISTAIAIGREICAPALLDRLMRVYGAVGLDVSHPVVTLENLVQSMTDTRANRAGSLNLVLPTGVGTATFVQEVGEMELARALALIEQRANAPTFA